MAIYHLRHASVGRSTHAAGTAGAHVSYITRTGACREVLGSDMPVPAAGERGGEARAWLDEQEAADRKNARVIDKVTIALPRELDAVQRVELVRAFAAEVTQGRVPWLAAVHDQGKDAENPHAHVVLRDRDLETGKMALRMSQKGSTEMLRETWERACNAALERAGVDERIDRRTLKAQGIERAPTKHIGPQALQIEAREPKSSWKIATLAREWLAANDNYAPAALRPASIAGRLAAFGGKAETFVKNIFGRKDKPAAPQSEGLRTGSERLTVEDLDKMRGLAHEVADLQDAVEALPLDMEAFWAAERAAQATRAPLEAMRGLGATRASQEASQEAVERTRELAKVIADALAPQIARDGPTDRYSDPETLQDFELRTGEQYDLALDGDEHQKLVRLVKEQLGNDGYDRFRQGDLRAVSGVTSNTVFARQLMAEVEMYERHNGYEFSDDALERIDENHEELTNELAKGRDYGRGR